METKSEFDKSQQINNNQENIKIPEKIVKEDYFIEVDLLCLIIPVSQLNVLTKSLRSHQDVVFTRPKFQQIQPYDDKHRLLLLSVNINEEFLKDIPKDHPLHAVYEQNPDIKHIRKQFTIKYDQMTYDEILSRFMPKGVQIPHGYETVGHIVHFNLIKEQIPYQYLIGQVLLDKLGKNFKTVVNKTEKLCNVFRTPKLELMAGEKLYEAEVKEGKLQFIPNFLVNCKFHLNIEKVYWNTKNVFERERVLQMVEPGQTVLDIAAKKGCKVIANDLNPACYEYLLQNSKLNNIDYNMLCYNMDAKDMIENFLNHDYLIQNNIKEPYHHFDHVFMNLPVLAIDFLSGFQGLLIKGNSQIWNENNLPLIHVYGFALGYNEQECRVQMVERIRNQLQFFKDSDIIHFIHLKNVTPHKKMFRITFRLSVEDARYDIKKSEQDIEKIQKKIKTDEEYKKQDDEDEKMN